jgi:acetyltransferase-like isoleucine patch superfamily enzyme
MRFVAGVLGLLLPWRLRRLFLRFVLGYNLHPRSRIGFSLVVPDYLEMSEGSRIGHFNLAKGLQAIRMGRASCIGNLNWITGYPRGAQEYYGAVSNRRPELRIGEHSAITNRHLIDCTDLVEIGAYSTIAGFRSQILTHTIDFAASVQSCRPVHIGAYCFTGTSCVIVAGARLPNFSILGGNSLLNRTYDEEYTFYEGVPARPVRKLDPAMAYFARSVGFVK